MMPYPYGGRSSYSVEKYDMGELVVDFIDTKQDKVVMRISAVGEITKPKQKTKNLFLSVEKILKAFAKSVIS
jgi:thermostable 8-oxoguanine DNA glycosylase